MTVDYELEDINEEAAWVGTTLGGVIGLRVALTGSVLAFVGAMLTFIAFYIQYEAMLFSRDNLPSKKRIWQKNGLKTSFLLCWIFTGIWFSRWKWRTWEWGNGFFILCFLSLRLYMSGCGS